MRITSRFKHYSSNKLIVQRKVLFVAILVIAAVFALFSLFIARQRLLTETVLADAAQCRSYVDSEQANCVENAIIANIGDCTAACETEIASYSDFFAYASISANEVCNNTCGYGNDVASACNDYATTMAVGYKDALPYMSCFQSCFDVHGDGDACTSACEQEVTATCETEATNIGIGSDVTFCAQLEAFGATTVASCNELENYGVYSSNLDYCENNGYPAGVNALFCDEATTSACETECLGAGVNAATCNQSTGACQFVAADLNAPTLSFYSNVLKSFNATFDVTGNADDSTAVALVEYQVGGTSGSWTACVCTDSTCDQPNEDYRCSVTGLSEGNNTVYFRATDSLANSTDSGSYYSKVINVDTTPTNDLVAHFAMEALPPVADAEGYSENLLNVNGTPVLDASGQTANALDFSGNTFGVVNDTSGQYSFNVGNAFTAEAWVKTATFGGNNARVLYKIDSGGFNTLWAMGIDTNGIPYCSLYDNSTAYTVDANSSAEIPALTNAQWNHIACAWDGASLTIVVNEFARYSQDLTASNITLDRSYSPINFGGNATLNTQFQGSIDEVKIYDEAKSYPAYDDTPPYIDITPRSDIERLADSTPTFTGTITDASNIATARYLFTNLNFLAYNFSQGTTDDLPWVTFNPADGTWDESSEEFSVTSSALSDGVKYLYIIAEDQYGNTSLYNQVGYLTDYVDSSDYVMAYKRFVVEVVDSTVPTIYAHSVVPDPTVDQEPYIHGYVQDSGPDTTSTIANAWYRVDGGTWTVITPFDGVYDELYEEFVATLPSMTAGSHDIEIRAIDSSNNDTNVTSVNYEDTFVVEAQVPSDSTEINDDEDFENHDFHDVIFTNGIWGNDYARLKQDINFTPTLKSYTNKAQYGYDYGGVQTGFGISPSVDGVGLWMTLNDHSIAYFNRSTNTLTNIGIPRTDVTIQQIYEFQYASSRYLIVAFEAGYASLLIDINNTPATSSDDTTYDWDIEFAGNEETGWGAITRDTRSSTLGFYLTVAATSNDNIAYLNMNGTPTNLADDTITQWGSGDGLAGAYNYTAFHFDQANDRFIASAYNYGLHICDDNGTPTNKGDDSCYSDAHDFTNGPAPQTFAIEYDSTSDGFWMGGNAGLYFVDMGLTADPVDDVWIRLASGLAISYERIDHIAVLPGTYPVGPEIIYSTREGHIRGLEINYTPFDTLDDTSYNYAFPFTENVEGGGSGFYMENANSLWMNLAREGLYQFTLARSFQNSNTIESLPNPPAGKLEVNHITLDSVLGTLGQITPLSILNVSNLSTLDSKSIADLSLALDNEPFNNLKLGLNNTAQAVNSYAGASFYVSNDAGATWESIGENQTVSFTDSDYQLKFKVVLNKLGSATPILDYVALNYSAYDTASADHRSIQLTNPTTANVGDQFPVSALIVDDLGHTVTTWSGTLDLTVHPSTSLGSLTSCITHPATMTVTNGVGAVTATAKCAGSFIFKAVDTSDPSILDYGNVITVTQVVTAEEIVPGELCGNGELDEGEECDGGVGDLQCSAYEGVNTGTLTCTDACKIDTSNCSYSETPIIPDDVDDVPILPVEDQKDLPSWIGYVGTFVGLLTLANLAGFRIVDLPALLLRTYHSILTLIGVRKKGQGFGFVYNSITKDAMAMAVVRIFNEEGKLAHTEVTDAYGAFTAVLAPAKYRIEVTKFGYKFPSMIVNKVADYPLENVYHGELFSYADQRDIVLAIPMDPAELSTSEFVGSLLSDRARELVYILMFLLLLLISAYSIYVYNIDNSLLNLLAVIFNILMLSLNIYFRYSKNYKFGVVRDLMGNKIEGFNVGLIRKDSKDLVARRVTDKSGLYRFIVNKGDFVIESIDEVYNLVKSEGTIHVENQAGKPKIIGKDLRVVKK